MKKALISPNEPVETGYRVAEVVATAFEVCPPLFWVDCSDDVFADLFWYNPENNQFEAVPEPEPVTPQDTNQPVVDGAQSL